MLGPKRNFFLPIPVEGGWELQSRQREASWGQREYHLLYWLKKRLLDVSLACVQLSSHLCVCVRVFVDLNTCTLFLFSKVQARLLCQLFTSLAIVLIFIYFCQDNLTQISARHRGSRTSWSLSQQLSRSPGSHEVKQSQGSHLFSTPQWKATSQYVDGDCSFFFSPQWKEKGIYTTDFRNNW